MKFAILGMGGRGDVYSHFIKQYGSEISAVCDTDQKRLEYAKIEYNVPESGLFNNEKEFFAHGKIADALVISTLDTLHYRQTMQALELGYDILLEKPIAVTYKQCVEIEKKAKKTGRKVVVCHVLRYAPFFNKIKEIVDSKILGNVVSIQLTESIGYYHFAHSYVRGNWRNEKISNPLILAKNCHDLDIICWLLGTKCINVSSTGGLKFFNKDNAPEGCEKFCYKCRYKDSCNFSAFKIYNNEKYEKIAGLARHGHLGETKEQINNTLMDEKNLYSRCVFYCDNDVCDHQNVSMSFENGVNVLLSSIAFSEEICRNIKIFFTGGVLYNIDEKSVFLEYFGGKKEQIFIEELKGGYANHMGGDVGIVQQFIDYISNNVKTNNITDISTSVMSHKIGFLAEKSRKNKSKTISL